MGRVIVSCYMLTWVGIVIASFFQMKLTCHSIPTVWLVVHFLTIVS